MHLVTMQVRQQRVRNLKNVRDAARRSKMHLVTIRAQRQRAPRLKNAQDVAPRLRTHLAMMRRTKKRRLQPVHRRESMFTSAQDVAIRPAGIFLRLATNGARKQHAQNRRSVLVKDVRKLIRRRSGTSMHGESQMKQLVLPWGELRGIAREKVAGM